MQRKDCGKPIQVLALAAMLLASTQASAATLSLWREAVIEGDTVRVADVCRIDGATESEQKSLGELVVVAAPIEGGSLVLAADEVRQALRMGGANLATVVLKGAANCEITRPRAVASQRIVYHADAPDADSDADAPQPRCLREIIADYFQTETGRANAHVNLRFGRANEEVLDLCEPQFAFRIERTTAQALGMVSLNVTLFQDGQAVRTVPLLVEVSEVAPVVVAARPINLGAIIGPDDVRVAEMSVNRRDALGSSDPRSVVGQRARRFIPTGTPLRALDLEAVPLVKRGQLVDVHSTVGGVSIVTAAQAMDDGVFGDVVSLRADGPSRQRIAAVVTGAGRVRIGGGEQTVAMGGGL